MCGWIIDKIIVMVLAKGLETEIREKIENERKKRFCRLMVTDHLNSDDSLADQSSSIIHFQSVRESTRQFAIVQITWSCDWHIMMDALFITPLIPSIYTPCGVAQRWIYDRIRFLKIGHKSNMYNKYALQNTNALIEPANLFSSIMITGCFHFWIAQLRLGMCFFFLGYHKPLLFSRFIGSLVNIFGLFYMCTDRFSNKCATALDLIIWVAGAFAYTWIYSLSEPNSGRSFLLA